MSPPPPPHTHTHTISLALRVYSYLFIFLGIVLVVFSPRLPFFLLRLSLSFSFLLLLAFSAFFFFSFPSFFLPSCASSSSYLSPSLPHILSFFYLICFLSSVLSTPSLLVFLFSFLSFSFVFSSLPFLLVLLSFCLFSFRLLLLVLLFPSASPSPLSSTPFPLLSFLRFLLSSVPSFPPHSSCLLVLFSCFPPCSSFLLCLPLSLSHYPSSAFLLYLILLFPVLNFLCFLLLSLCSFSSVCFFSLSSFFLWLPLPFVSVVLSLSGLFSSSSSFPFLLSFVFLSLPPFPWFSVRLVSSSSRGFAFFRLVFFLLGDCLHPRVLLFIRGFFCSSLFTWPLSACFRPSPAALLSSIPPLCGRGGGDSPPLYCRSFYWPVTSFFGPSLLLSAFVPHSLSLLRLFSFRLAFFLMGFSSSLTTVACLYVVSFCYLFLLPACLIASCAGGVFSSLFLCLGVSAALVTLFQGCLSDGVCLRCMDARLVHSYVRFLWYFSIQCALQSFPLVLLPFWFLSYV